MIGNTTGLTAIKRSRAAIYGSILIAACCGMMVPALASSQFDGDWSVVITTRGGGCDPSFRYGVQIDNGRVLDNGGSGAMVQGRVTPNGAVSVSVRSGGEWANGSGRLGLTSGGGVWRGQGSSGACEGTWVAERRGGAAAEIGGRPLYNYAPGASGAWAPRQYYYAPGTYGPQRW